MAQAGTREVAVYLVPVRPRGSGHKLWRGQHFFFEVKMSQQKTIVPTGASSRAESNGEDVQKERDTSNFLYSYVFTRSSTDTTLTSEEDEIFQITNREVGDVEGAAVQVGRRLAELGERAVCLYRGS